MKPFLSGPSLLFWLALGCILAGIVAGGPPAKAAGDAFVRVAPETIAKSERISLGDVAAVVCDTDEAALRLKAIDLGFAPDAGSVRELPLEKIRMAIAAAGFPKDGVTVVGPDIAIIRRATQTIDLQYIREAVERAVLAELRGAGASVRLTRLDLPPVVEVPAGATEVRASIGAGRDLLAPFPASIEVWAEGRMLRKFTAMAQAEAFAPVLVASHDIQSGSRLHEEDAVLELCRLSRPVNSYVRDVSLLHGQAARGGLVRGEPLLLEKLYPDLVIKPGDPVTVIAVAGALYVEVKAEARGAGHVGDRIPVKNIQSGLILQAIVQDEGLVRVQF